MSGSPSSVVPDRDRWFGQPSESESTDLTAADWGALAAAHEQRADRLTAGYRARKARGEKHAVEDFLFDYYSAKPAQLRRWNPGAGVRLLPGSEPVPQSDRRWYRTDPDGAVTVDVAGFMADRGDTVRFIHGLLSAVSSRPIATGCFGLHEWAMVYRQGPGEHRHALPLRLGESGTDTVVETHRIRCTHIDAYRFFTPEAAPLNTLRPTRDSQVRDDQGGCLHANMDLYKWAQKLGPLCPGDLLLDCFELAADVRVTDMQASPYDVSAYGLEPVTIETPDGKAEYVRRQREFAERAGVLRGRLVAVSAI